jgi:hypothetical protein
VTLQLARRGEHELSPGSAASHNQHRCARAAASPQLTFALDITKH